MSDNHDLQKARDYHNATKHSYQSIRSDAHALDWENYPLAFKVYEDLDPIPLPIDVPLPTLGALEAISAGPPASDGETVPDAGILGRLLLLTAGITKKRKYPGGEMLYRAAACTGALYHIDVYVVCDDLEGLEAGVYHFSPHDFSLRRLRKGDHRAVLIRASGEEPSLLRAPIVLTTVSTYWRNAWKYRSRAYRHCGWDNGTLLANLLASAAGYSVSAKIVCGFVDNNVNRLFDLEPGREAALSLIPLGREMNPPSSAALPEMEPLGYETVPISKCTVDYPAIRELHSASCLDTPEEVARWRDQDNLPPSPTPTGRTFPLKPSDNPAGADDLVSNVIIRRGSSRQFARRPLTFEQLSNALERALTGIPADFLETPSSLVNDVYVIVHAVDGLPAGKYVYHPGLKSLELLEEGDFRSQSGYLGLEQRLPADASVNIYFMLDLEPVLERFGNRGYRVAQLEAGLLGGRLYLASYAQNFGATGLTFFDDDVTDFFSPHARGKSVMFLMALGHKLKPEKS